MPLALIVLVGVMLGRLTLALSLPPADPSNITSESDSLPSLNISSLGRGHPVCDGNFYGFNLNKESCRQIVEDIVYDEALLYTYINRMYPTSTGDRIPMPQRFLSCELCFNFFSFLSRRRMMIWVSKQDKPRADL